MLLRAQSDHTAETRKCASVTVSFVGTFWKNGVMITGHRSVLYRCNMNLWRPRRYCLSIVTHHHHQYPVTIHCNHSDNNINDSDNNDHLSSSSSSSPSADAVIKSWKIRQGITPADILNLPYISILVISDEPLSALLVQNQLYHSALHRSLSRRLLLQSSVLPSSTTTQSSLSSSSSSSSSTPAPKNPPPILDVDFLQTANFILCTDYQTRESVLKLAERHARKYGWNYADIERRTRLLGDFKGDGHKNSNNVYRQYGNMDIPKFDLQGSGFGRNAKYAIRDCCEDVLETLVANGLAI